MKQDNFGFTLIELLIVMAIVAMLGAIIGPNIFRGLDSSKCDAAATQINNLGMALDQHRLDVGKYPQSLDGLVRDDSNSARWDGPYLPKGKKLPQDPWGQAYQYKYPGDHGDYDLFSYGADGKQGGEGCPDADITSWDE